MRREIGGGGTHSEAPPHVAAVVGPEQLRQTNTPRFTLAHVGPRDPQSAQRLLSSCLSSADKIALCRSFC